MSGMDTPQTPPQPQVTVTNHIDRTVDPSEQCGAMAAATIGHEGVTYGHVDLLFVDKDTMSDLNLTHMGKDGPTDVLAFPLDAPSVIDGETLEIVDGGPPVHLGDIVMCPEVIEKQAPEHCGSIEAEYCLLTVHAALHLLGHDHVTESERARMQRQERLHLNRYGYQHPEASVAK